MKVKLTNEQIQKVIDDPEQALKAGVKATDPWWVIALKVVSYLIGLILAGATTAGCARMLII